MLTVSDQNKIALFVRVQLEWCDFTLLDTLASGRGYPTVHCSHLLLLAGHIASGLGYRY